MRTSKKVLLYAMICIAVHKLLEAFLLYSRGLQFSDISVVCWYIFWGYELRLLAGLKKVEMSNPYSPLINIPNINTSANTKPPEDAAE